jgi:hypothetical protein
VRFRSVALAVNGNDCPLPLYAVHTEHIDLYKGKGKSIPLQAWTGPECASRVKLPDFKTIDT